jgi:hypothetical protein
MHIVSTRAFLKLWSAGGFGRKSSEKLYQALNNEKYTHSCLLKLPLLVDLLQKGELILFITPCPSIIILENVVMVILTTV